MCPDQTHLVLRRSPMQDRSRLTLGQADTHLSGSRHQDLSGDSVPTFQPTWVPAFVFSHGISKRATPSASFVRPSSHALLQSRTRTTEHVRPPSREDMLESSYPVAVAPPISSTRTSTCTLANQPPGSGRASSPQEDLSRRHPSAMSAVRRALTGERPPNPAKVISSTALARDQPSGSPSTRSGCLECDWPKRDFRTFPSDHRWHSTRSPPPRSDITMPTRVLPTRRACAVRRATGRRSSASSRWLSEKPVIAPPPDPSWASPVEAAHVARLQWFMRDRRGHAAVPLAVGPVTVAATRPSTQPGMIGASIDKVWAQKANKVIYGKSLRSSPTQRARADRAPRRSQALP